MRVVKNLSLSYFPKKLIEHFDSAFSKDEEVQWPGKRNGEVQVNFYIGMPLLLSIFFDVKCYQLLVS